MKLSDYLAWISHYGWSLRKAGIDWKLVDENGAFVCSIKIKHPGPKEVVAPSVQRTEKELRARGIG